jgi:hypothetical protein
MKIDIKHLDPNPHTIFAHELAEAFRRPDVRKGLEELLPNLPLDLGEDWMEGFQAGAFLASILQAEWENGEPKPKAVSISVSREWGQA